MKLGASQTLAELYFRDIKNVQISQTLAEKTGFTTYKMIKRKEIKNIRACLKLGESRKPFYNSCNSNQ